MGHDERLGHGFYGIETDWRWTDGTGWLSLCPADRPRVLTIDVAGVAQPASRAA